MTERELVEECYREAETVLLENSTPEGILASAPQAPAIKRGYGSIFGRDASICAIGMAATRRSDLLRHARNGLLTLGNHQARNGQIPKLVRPDRPEVDFWYAGCIDATLWWLIALKIVDRLDGSQPISSLLTEKIAHALRWLECQEHQVWYLLQQNEASDWADIMPRSGFVLYTNALWYWTKRLYELPTAGETRSFANLLLAPFENTVPEHRRVRLFRHFVRRRCKPTPFFLSFVNLSVWGEELDIFGNILAYLVGIAPPSCAEAAIARLVAMKANVPYPVRVVGMPITPQSPLWREYMQRHRQNYPWQYHNGGIWPFVGGFWILLLAKLGKEQLAWSELVRLAQANQVNQWEFNEWFDGKDGIPMGMARQSWNAALFVLAYRALLFNERVIP